MLVELEKLYTYQNQHVLNRYKKDHPNNALSAEEAFHELMNYFWLCDKYRKDKNLMPTEEILNFECTMHFEMKEIDDMWHSFILFTKDYAEFGMQYFGYFLHHEPNIDNNPQPTEESEVRLRRYLSYIYDNLGEKTLKLWFREYFLDK